VGDRLRPVFAQRASPPDDRLVIGGGADASAFLQHPPGTAKVGGNVGDVVNDIDGENEVEAVRWVQAADLLRLSLLDGKGLAPLASLLQHSLRRIETLRHTAGDLAQPAKVVS
jgi:hypothetical protein